MKFIFLTDSHIKGVNPGRRKDIYYVSILKKFLELEYVIKQENIDFVVHGGDLFDAPKVSNKLFGQIASILKGYGKQIFVVPGNHDVYGQNIDTLDHTSLGALAKAKVVTLMTRDNSPYYFQKKSEPGCPLVAFTGQEYYSGIDKGLNNDYEIEPSQAAINILVAHGMLLDKPFHPDVPHTVIDNVQTSANMVLSGHYHPGPSAIDMNGTTFINPGSTARVEISKRMPQYAIIDITDKGVTYELRPFNCADSFDDVFDFAGAAEQKEHKGTLEAFKKTVKDIDVHDANSINDIMQRVVTTLNVTPEDVNAVLTRIAKAQQLETDKSLNGYIPDLNPVQITKVILHNFQSHDHSEVDFNVNALIALIGESDNGKTSILRGIKWVLYNDPKGTDFIRQGESTCYVTLEFSNGNKVTRQRTNSGAGFYEVYDAKTKETQKYTGFSHTVPMEVYNAHQMPKIAIGKEQVSFNISEQLDGPFMLSQSASDRAAIIGKITGVQVLDTAIQEISKDISNLQKDIKSTERDLESSEKDLAQFTDLPAMEQNITMAELLIASIDATENQKSFYQGLQQDIDNFNMNLAIESHNLTRFQNLDTIETLLIQIEAEQEKNLSLKAIESDYIYNFKEIHDTEAKIKRLGYVDELENLVESITVEADQNKLLNSLDYELNSVLKDIRVVTNVKNSLGKITEEMIKELEDTYNDSIYLSALSVELGAVDSDIKDLKSTIDFKEEMLKANTIKYRELLKNLGGKCHICGHELEDSIIDTLDL